MKPVPLLVPIRREIMVPDKNCPIRGHNHKLELVREITQEGTGKKGYLLECPSGNYRFLFIEGLHDDPTSGVNMPKMKKPRWGWKK